MIVDFDLNRGIRAFKEGDYAATLSCLEPLAKKGNPMAQLYMGVIYSSGHGDIVQENLGHAQHWFRLAAHQGSAEAQFRYAVCLLSKQTIESNHEAIRWVEKAASQGHEIARNNLRERHYSFFFEKLPDDAESFKALTRLAKHGNGSAQLMVGVAYDRGYYDVQQDLSVAAYWYRKAAEQDLTAAQTNLGMMCARGIGVRQDDVEACKWYRKAAEQGEPVAQHNLGFMCEHGRGVSKNDVLAAELYLKAAEQGFDLAQNNIGLAYKYGRGVAKDATLAYQWFMKATEQGNAGAQFQVGRCLECGTGVAQNYAEAARWYRLAAEQDEPMACQNLGHLYENGYGVPADHREAVAFYRKGAELGLASSQCCLAFMYLLGEGIQKDLGEAIKWFSEAATGGDQRAIDALAILKPS